MHYPIKRTEVVKQVNLLPTVTAIADFNSGVCYKNPYDGICRNAVVYQHIYMRKLMRKPMTMPSGGMW